MSNGTPELREKRVSWRWVLALVVPVGAAILIAVFLFVLPYEPKTPAMLSQLHTAFKMYSNEAKGEMYPPKAPAPDVFAPSSAAISAYLAEVPDGEALAAYLRGECGVEVCYLGYVLHNQRFGMVFLDALKKAGPAFPNEDIQCESFVWDYDHYWGRLCGQTLWRIREGIERFFIRDIMSPVASSQARSKIPVLWEMPDTQTAPGGWVLYMDGRSEWLPYPGEFPMNEAFIRGLREVMGPPKRRTRAKTAGFVSRPPPWWQRPKPQPVRLPDALAACTPLTRMDIAHVDEKPSVVAAGSRGYRLRTGFAEFVLFPVEDAVRPELKTTLWLSGPRGTPYPSLTRPFCMGVGHGVQWFALTTVEIQDDLRGELGLEGGDDRLQLMIDTNSFHLMPRLGARAIPYLESVVQDDSEFAFFTSAIMALDRIDDPRAQQVIRAAFGPGNLNAVRNAKALIEATTPYYGPHRQPPRDATIELAIEGLLRECAPDQLARMATEWALRCRGWRLGRINEIGCQLLRRLPREAYDKPLDQLLEPDPDTNPRARQQAEQRWKEIRQELRSEP